MCISDSFQAVTLVDFSDPDPFDAVVASLALHHIADLSGALDKVALLLRSAGRLIVNEHAFDRLDEPTARWYLEKRAQTRRGAPRSLQACLHEWRDDHAGLHGYAAMRQELDRRFDERFFAWTPYLHGELGGAVSRQEERALIDTGTIQATGFRYVGERTTPASAQTQRAQGSRESGADEERSRDAQVDHVARAACTSSY
jgi:SAM-dependent methyltransferase